MRIEVGCYCGAVRYVAEGEAVLRAQMPLPRAPVFLGRSA